MRLINQRVSSVSEPYLGDILFLEDRTRRTAGFPVNLSVSEGSQERKYAALLVYFLATRFVSLDDRLLFFIVDHD